ncbi:site-specific tyrosine recombinase [Variovorax phage VarioGold]|uniref:tyrosine-type recombinase/integrase n=1 Tax=Variovorax sp. ZS18.2.2 TaxID=2971255 RepID=UPI00215186ED|nr:integrase arm-type DNA-binding domain-containing protein [Variovorax sp. ZS18.2.2]MCR6477559.1 tyrosine-type recombinase/integrase [Variovorax sp. ZS18.2.2]UYD72077.1 site-specific tyrosine recombinase [Variovorax phage VarioGold]
MPTNTLTDHLCKTAKPTAKDRKIFDGHGLYLFVSAKGAKVWRMAYRVDGKPKTKSLGDYPLLSLAEARVRCAELRKGLQAGVVPTTKKKRAASTFWQDCEAFWNGRQDVSPDYRANALRGIELHLKPNLGDLATAEIDRGMLLAELNRMDAGGKFVYVRKVRMWVSQVFDWAVEQELASINPAELINPKKAFGRRKVKNHASLELAEVHEFVRRLGFEKDLNSVLACKFLAYTWVRTNEMRMMKFDEVDGDTWLIGGERMKRDKDHIVPLSRQALEILEKMRARRRPGCDYVFPADHRIDRPISENGVLALIARLGYKGEMTGHGWRSIASTWANEEGYGADAIERQLAHSPEDKVRAAYNRAEYMRERRPMLQAWADWLEKPYAGSAEG